jgi:nucleoside-diphosphate-sugar epimerase
MKVLLTGDKGYIGTVMKSFLRKYGHDVTGLDSNYFQFCTFGDVDLYEIGEYHIPKDIRDVSVSDLKGYDAVIHLASLSNDLMGDFNHDLTMEINLYATLTLASKAKRAGVKKFIFASSCSVYGANDHVVDEDALLNPVTTYARCKAEAEKGISALADENFSPTLMRNATVFGFSPRHRNDLIVNTMTSHAYANGVIHINGDGQLWRPLVSVKDVAKAFLLVLEADRHLVHNEVFNVGFDCGNYTVADVAKLVWDNLPTTIEYHPSNDTRNYRVKFEKISKVFPDFSVPLMTVEQGIEELVEIYKDNEAIHERSLTHDELLGDKYIRILHLKYLLEIGSLDENLVWTR